MRPSTIVDHLNRFLVKGLATEIFLAVQTHKVNESGRTSKILPQNRIGMITNGGIAPSEYIAVLDRNTYSAVFQDGSIIYMECSFEGRTLIDHRYLFIPCPFDDSIVSQRPNHILLADWLRDSFELGGQDAFSSRGAFRFDCARNVSAEARDPPPVSHLTFGSGDCRLPLRGPMPVSSFLNLVFDNFYRPQRPVWAQFKTYLNLDQSEVTIRQSEGLLHHINWEPQ